MRSAVCPKCGTRKLRRIALESGGFYLADWDSRERHDCAGSPIPQSGEVYRPDFLSRDMMPQDDDKPKDDDPIVPAGSHYLTAKLYRYVKTGANVLLVGPAGSGKTSAAKVVARMLDITPYSRPMGPTVGEVELLGFMNAAGEFTKGAAYDPYKTGGMLILDELDASHPSGLLAINEVCANGSAGFPNGETVHKHETSRIVGTANTFGLGANQRYSGRAKLDAASLDRWVILEWGYDEAAEFDWAGRDRSDWVRFVQAVRKVVLDHALEMVVSPRASIDGAKLLRAGVAMADVIESTVWKGCGTDMRERILPHLPAQYRDMAMAA